MLEASEPMVCSFCQKSFSSKVEFDGHMWRHTGKKPYKCDICGRTYTSLNNLKLHTRKHGGLKTFKCSFCPKLFGSRAVLDAHEHQHSGRKSFKCGRCPKVFSSFTQKQGHERMHCKESKKCQFRCESCGQAFVSNLFKKAHIMRKHGNRLFSCQTCDDVFADAQSLRSHVCSSREETGSQLESNEEHECAGEQPSSKSVLNGSSNISKGSCEALPEVCYEYPHCNSVQYNGKDQGITEMVSDCPKERESPIVVGKTLTDSNVLPACQCQICGSLFHSMQATTAHVKLSHGDDLLAADHSVYFCTLCGRTFVKAEVYVRHQIEKHNHEVDSVRLFVNEPMRKGKCAQCLNCGCQQASALLLSEHMKQTHFMYENADEAAAAFSDYRTSNFKETYICPFCLGSLLGKQAFTVHLQQNHSGEPMPLDYSKYCVRMGVAQELRRLDEISRDSYDDQKTVECSPVRDVQNAPVVAGKQKRTCLQFGDDPVDFQIPDRSKSSPPPLKKAFSSQKSLSSVRTYKEKIAIASKDLDDSVETNAVLRGLRTYKQKIALLTRSNATSAQTQSSSMLETSKIQDSYRSAYVGKYGEDHFSRRHRSAFEPWNGSALPERSSYDLLRSGASFQSVDEKPSAVHGVPSTPLFDSPNHRRLTFPYESHHSPPSGSLYRVSNSSSRFPADRMPDLIYFPDRSALFNNHLSH